MKIYCIRHGEAKTDLEDPRRPLSIQGNVDINKMADFMVVNGVCTSHILHSGVLRAEQTASIIAEKLNLTEMLEQCSGLDGGAPVQPMVDMINAWEDDTVVVSHLPFVSDLVSALLMDQENSQIVSFSPGTLVCLERCEQQRWLLSWVMRPEVLR